ncbi:MAG: ABC transporter ATP-binding protein [Lachnospiraceae bacterium]|jgi:ABC-2 type transport system ATP-binding protein|nr:ABC transporter ATP-binding protein [Lachnospiraceae bacterium]
MNEAIKISSLTKSYETHTVLKGLDFCVHQGEIFALLGINGAGKTTSLECIEGLRKYDSGNITINGIMGIQLQSASMPKYMKALEAVKLFAKWNKTSPDRATLDALGIYELAKKPYYQLSTGQKRRLHLALALTRNPDILFLDEPTAGLDVEGQISLHEQIRQLKAMGKTSILASHDMAEVEKLCDRIAILSGGKIAFIGTVDELGKTIGKHYNITIQTVNRTEKYESENIGDSLLSLLMQYREKGEAITDIQIDRGSLEQHFIKIAKGEQQ